MPPSGEMMGLIGHTRQFVRPRNPRKGAVVVQQAQALQGAIKKWRYCKAWETIL